MPEINKYAIDILNDLTAGRTGAGTGADDLAFPALWSLPQYFLFKGRFRCQRKHHRLYRHL